VARTIAGALGHLIGLHWFDETDTMRRYADREPRT